MIGPCSRGAFTYRSPAPHLSSTLSHSGRLLMNSRGSNGSLSASMRGLLAALVSGRAFAMPVRGKVAILTLVRKLLFPEEVPNLHDVEHSLCRKQG